MYDPQRKYKVNATGRNGRADERIDGEVERKERRNTEEHYQKAETAADAPRCCDSTCISSRFTMANAQQNPVCYFAFRLYWRST